MPGAEKHDAAQGRLALRGDVLAGVSVGVVLLPQALAYAELAGVPAERGLLVGGVAALIGALAGSSPTLQTGPTALASLLTFGVLADVVVVTDGDWVALAGALAVLVGVFRFLAGLLHVGKVSYLLSSPALTGLAAGAGLLIVATQVPDLLGVVGATGDPLDDAVSAALHPGAADGASVLVGTVALAIMLGARRVPWLPGALLALVGGGVVAALAGGVEPVVLRTPQVQFGLGGVGLAGLRELTVPALVIAFVGFGEVTAIARSRSSPAAPPWDPDRELVGQGLASFAAGLAGGFPVSGSFSRSALNEMAGATTRRSGVVTGLLVLALLPLLRWFPPLPRPALAAVVVVAGASLVRPGKLLGLWRVARLQGSVALLSFLATIWLSPRIDQAVVVGVTAAALAHLVREERAHVRVTQAGQVLTIRFEGVLFYLSMPRVERDLWNAVDAAPDLSEVELDLAGVGRLDVSGAQALSDVVEHLERRGLKVHIVSVPLPARAIVSRTPIGRRQ